jgi:hypothetical protein
MLNSLYMRSIRMRAPLCAAALCLAALMGCDNQLPTVTGDGAFPGDRVPVTLEVTVPTSQLVVSDTVFEGFDTPLSYLLVANAFDGALTAHALARFSGYPDSVIYSVGGVVRTEKSFVYGAGRITAQVDSASSSPRAPASLELLAVAQDWDTTAVSWENAVDRPTAPVRWRTPGGTPGSLISRVTWTPGDTTQKDSLSWTVDSLTVARLARGEVSGVLVRSASVGSRLEISRLTLSYGIRPAGKPDTTIAQQLTTGTQTFLLTPDPPAGAGFYRVGGLTGARTVLRLDLSQKVSNCAPPATAAGCTTVPLSSVELDQATLLLDSAPVPFGFRPLKPALIELRRLLEPELGARSPLGDLLVSVAADPAAFKAGGQRAIAVPLTASVGAAAATTTQTLDLALLSGVGANDFGTVWFTSAPRLRLLYTVPRQPTLP